MTYDQPIPTVEGVYAPKTQTTKNMPSLADVFASLPEEYQEVLAEHLRSEEEKQLLAEEDAREQVYFAREEALTPFIPRGNAEEVAWTEYHMMWEVMRANNNTIPVPIYLDETEFYSFVANESKGYFVGYVNGRIELLSFDEDGNDVRIPVSVETLKLMN